MAKTRKRPERDFLLVLAGSVGGALLAASLMAVCARAWTWVQLGVGGFLVAIAVSIEIVLRFDAEPRPARRKLRRVALALSVIAFVRLGIAIAPAPATSSVPFVRSDFLDDSNPTFWFGGVPEEETVSLGAWVGLMRTEYEKGAPAIRSLYRELDPRTAPPSVLLDSWFTERGHAWFAAPEGKGPFPLIVFVHGNGGNFLFYPQLLARAAVAKGFAIAFPTNGFGFWGGKSAADRIARTVDHLARTVPIDRSRVVLVGLSAGGPGVLDAGALDPRYAGVVSLSGAPHEPVDPPGLRGTPVLYVHGADDSRCSMKRIHECIATLRAAGVAVDLTEEPKADHLLLATHRDRIVPLLLEWAAARAAR